MDYPVFSRGAEFIGSKCISGSLSNWLTACSLGSLTMSVSQLVKGQEPGSGPGLEPGCLQFQSGIEKLEDSCTAACLQFMLESWTHWF